MSKRAGSDDPAPKLKGARRAAVPTLAEFANLTPTFQTKKMNDRGGAYVGIDINGQWPCFAPVAAPEYMHLLHGKNLYQGASGAARQENICLALPEFLDDACTKPSDYKAHLAAFVDKVHAHVFENRVDYLGKKFAKYDAAMTKLSFSDAYKEADDGKPPFLRIVLSDKKDPPITLRKLAGETGAWTAATPGSIKNLTAGAAIVPVIALFGGIWIVGVITLARTALQPHPAVTEFLCARRSATGSSGASRRRSSSRTRASTRRPRRFRRRWR